MREKLRSGLLGSHAWLWRLLLFTARGNGDGDGETAAAGEPMADGVSSLALASCDELAELKGHGAGMEHESQALSAAVTLFAAVFRLQTSDVRQ